MRQILSAEWLKEKHTPIRWMIFCVPSFFGICIASYVSYRSTLPSSFIFEGFFSVWTAIFLPLISGILSGYIVEEEEMAGNFTGFFHTKLSRRTLYLGKFLLVWFQVSIATSITTGILCFGVQRIREDEKVFRIFAIAFVFTLLGALPVIAISLWVSFLWGMGATIGVSIFSLLIATLFGTTSLGDGIWFFIPWCWVVKLSMVPSVYFLQGEPATFQEAMVQSLKIMSLTVGGFLVILFGSIRWFSKWEGRKNSMI